MNPSLALGLYIAAIAGLIYLDRDKSARPSKALWLPIIWLSIAGSRSVASWLGMGPGRGTAGQEPPTSLLDQAVAVSLMLLGAIVLVRRGGVVWRVLKANWPVALYFSFCLVSLLWSDFAGWGFKRWVRALGDLVMVLIVATDPQPTVALKRLFSRIGLVLLPASVLLIKYYPGLGQGFDDFGYRQYTGVTTDKNTLGGLVFIIVLAALWQGLSLVRNRKAPNRTRRLLAQCALLGFGINLLSIAHCATAVACCLLGVGLMLATSLPFIRNRPAAMHALVSAVLLGGGLISLLGGRAALTEAVGRKPDLTGRTVIWEIVIPMVPNPIGGAGFETFWLGPRVERIFGLVGGPQMTNEAHNGYIEVYLNLGFIGLALIALILGQGYLTSIRVFRRDGALGALLMAYVVTAVTYNISEACFRMLGLEWFILLLSIVVANRITGAAKCPPQSPRLRLGGRSELAASVST